MEANRFISVVSGEDRSPTATGLRALLSAATPFYRTVVGVRNLLFDRGIRKPTKLPRPVISVGNLTTGGTGKTPIVLEIARRIIAAGGRPAILLRGYKSEGGVSDEAELFRAELGDQAQVEPDPNRVAAASRVLHRDPSVTVFILDDGFQHRQVARDLDLVLVDATQPFGFGRLLPRGLLREPATNLRRAHGVIVTRCDQASDLADLDRRIAQLAGAAPIAHVEQRWCGWRVATPAGEYTRFAETSEPLEHLRAARVFGVCAIGNPNAFERQLRAAIPDVAQVSVWPDHHGYSELDIVWVYRQAYAMGARALVMTEKDWVKWSRVAFGPTPGDSDPRLMEPWEAGDIPIARPILQIYFRDGDDALGSLLSGVLRSRR